MTCRRYFQLRVLQPRFSFPVAAVGLEELDKAVLKITHGSGVLGMAIAVVSERKVVRGKGYGWPDAGNRLPVTAHTLFQAASLSKPMCKPMCAWVAMHLVEYGKLILDSPLSRYLDRWRLPASAFDNDGVTLRRILSHIAGPEGIRCYIEPDKQALPQDCLAYGLLPAAPDDPLALPPLEDDAPLGLALPEVPGVA